MASHDAWRYLHKAIRGESVPKNMRSEYDREDIYGPGSVNIRSMQAANDLWWSIHHDRSRVQSIRDAWMVALTRRNWWDIEPYSRHRYGVWIWEAQLVVWAAAVHLKDQLLRRAAAESLETCHVLLALSAGWEAYTPKEDSRQTGYRTTMTGARSWVAHRPDGTKSYRDDQGMWYRPAGLDYSPCDNILWWVLRKGKATGERADVVKAVISKVGDPRKKEPRLVEGLADLVSGKMKAIQGLPERFSSHQVTPVEKCVVVRTTKSVGFLVLRSVNPGSTHFRYGQAWSTETIRDTGDVGLDYPKWDRDKRMAWLVADDPTRQGGVSGRAGYEVEGGRVMMWCQDKDGRRWTPHGGWSKGRNEIQLPGEVVSIVEYGRNGMEIVHPKDEIPPEPPGPEPTGDSSDPSWWVKYRYRVIAGALALAAALAAWCGSP